MRQVLGITAIILTLISGGVLASAADRSTDQPGKGQTSDATKGKQKQRDKQETKGVGPNGESEQGGAGPSGPAPLPPGQAPGFEGANKDQSKSPTSGGPR